jgi:hypothetical protein
MSWTIRITVVKEKFYFRFLQSDKNILLTIIRQIKTQSQVFLVW